MKPVIGIFAHPDDEVFGPGGALALFAKEGRDTYIICVTDGDAGENSSDDPRSLGEIRREELQHSAKALGVKEVFFLDYKDGTLSNSLYHEVADKIKIILERLDPEIILTMEQRGVSGHLDHIAVSMISSYVFEHMPSIREIWYYVLTEQARSLQAPYFIYFPPGYKPAEISKTLDISPVWDQKVDAMHQHKSQKHDMDKIIGQFMKRPKEEYFIIAKQPTKDKE
ncbi:MAG TPA: PIG-L deacetylase family protein [Candidatus Saccharimonadales bacterium]|nr:PIG-L deacetylase family protein [Candidatus Saccharimonadales bacterium]